MNSSKRVLVTGGAGFIGSHVVDRLVGDGYSVRVLDNLSSGSTFNIEQHLSNKSIEFIKGDIRDADAVKKSLKDVHAVVHLAALVSVSYSIEHPNSTFDVNLYGTLNLLQYSALEGVEKFVFASSCAVYGDPQYLPVAETNSVRPISPYAESKLLGERYCKGFFERQFIDTVILRFFNVYGPRQQLSEYGGVIARYIKKVHNGDPLVIYGDGSQTRDFVNVSDVIDAVIKSIKYENVAGETINVGSGRPTSINELALIISELAASKVAIQYEAARPGDIYASYADISKAKKLLEYEPKISLRDGLYSLLKNKIGD